MAKHNATDTANAQGINFNKLGAVSKTFVHFDLAVDGTGIVEDPRYRVMGAAISPAHAAEQVALIAAAGGLVAGRILAEDGKSLR